jgi:FdhE protein
VAAAGVSGELLGFLACASLRPILEAYFAECRPHLAEGTWSLGTCPFCGAPPAFADLIEDGRRRLACHLCGGGWIFSRACCPFCGTVAARDLIRLLPDGTEEGYAVEACRPCGGFVKELDRRVRWNGGSALVEDWGSPHLDLVAERAGYRRAVPTLVQLQRPR